MGWKGSARSLGALARQIERDAVKRQRELERQRSQLQKMQEMDRAAYEVQVYENYIDVLLSIHKDSNEIFDWKFIQSTTSPIKPEKSDSNERYAQKNLNSFKPRFSDKLLNRVETKREELIAAIENGKIKDEEQYQESLRNHKLEYEDWKVITELAKRILLGDVTAYDEAIKKLDPFSEISKLGSSIQVEINDKHLAEVTLRVNGENVIPSEVKTLLKSGKLSTKQMTKTRFYELYQDYVCGGVLRVARELFALLPIELIIITSIGELLNTKTGHTEEKPTLSVAMSREALNRLNFDMLDPSDSIENFVHRMMFQKTKGFQAIEKISSSDLNSL
mgnify:CR=1 FL=1